MRLLRNLGRRKLRTAFTVIGITIALPVAAQTTSGHLITRRRSASDGGGPEAVDPW